MERTHTMKMPPAFADEARNVVNIIIETPRDSRVKYAYDEDYGLFCLKRILPPDVVFPLDFGFIPGTKGEDGDPLDVLLFMERPSFPGCMVAARLLGVMEAKQKKKGGKSFYRNDRFLAVACESHDYDQIHAIDDLNAYQLQSFAHFFEYYHGMEGNKIIPLENRGIKEATASIKRQQT